MTLVVLLDVVVIVVAVGRVGHQRDLEPGLVVLNAANVSPEKWCQEFVRCGTVSGAFIKKDTLDVNANETRCGRGHSRERSD